MPAGLLFPFAAGFFAAGFAGLLAGFVAAGLAGAFSGLPLATTAGLGGVFATTTGLAGAATGATAVATTAFPLPLAPGFAGVAATATGAAAAFPRPRFTGGGGGGGGGGGASGFRNFKVSVRDRNLPSNSSSWLPSRAYSLFRRLKTIKEYNLASILILEKHHLPRPD